jgi:hypothetical protein
LTFVARYYILAERGVTMEQYFLDQPKEKNGVIQNLYFILETVLGTDPVSSGKNVRLEVMSVLPDEVENMGKIYEFVRQSPGIMPVFRLK